LATLTTAAVSAVLGSSTTALTAAALFVGLIVSYVACITAASLLIARGNGWRLLPYLPVVLAAFHFSYGTGFLVAFWRCAFDSQQKVASESVFARITR
jgi:hypothetical protein